MDTCLPRLPFGLGISIAHRDLLRRPKPCLKSRNENADPLRGPALYVLIAGAGWPSPLRGSVSLDDFIPMLRIGPSRLEPALHAEPNPDHTRAKKYASPLSEDWRILLVAGARLQKSLIYTQSHFRWSHNDQHRPLRLSESPIRVRTPRFNHAIEVRILSSGPNKL